MQEFNGRVAVVTGGASGIGFGLASAFAAEGMKIVLGDIEAPALADAVGKLEASGAEVIGVRTDVSDAAQVQALADAAVERFGAIHIACNNAGVGAGGLSWEAPLDTWEWVFGVNLWGVIHGCALVRADHDASRPEAHVVNTASIAGLVAGPFMAPYNASKHAVVALSETLAPRDGDDGAAREGLGAVPGLGADPDRRQRANRPGIPEAIDPPASAVISGMLQPLIDNGMAPEEVAAKVLAAIRAEQFWVLPHDGVEEFWTTFVNERAQSLIDRTNPTFRSPADG